MRCFVALLPEKAFLDALGPYMGELSKRLAGWRWVRPEGAHLTLGFLGELSVGHAVGLGKAMAGLEAWASAGGLAPADLERLSSMRFSRLSRLPASGRPRTLVLAPSGGSDPAWGVLRAILMRLAELTKPVLGPKADQVFGGSFTAHLSLARAKDGRPDLPRGSDLPSELNRPFCFGRVGLMESILGPGGSRYRALAQATLVKHPYTEDLSAGGQR